MRIFFDTAQNNHAMRNHNRRGSSVYVIKYVSTPLPSGKVYKKK